MSFAIMQRVALFASFLLLAKVSASPSVLFLDQTEDSYFKGSDAAVAGDESYAMSPGSFAAATAALLGVSVPPHTDAIASAQLNSLLIPDPFNRPRSVLALVLPGADSAMVSNMSAGSVRVVQSRALTSSPPADASSLMADVDHELAAMWKGSREEGLDLHVAACSSPDASAAAAAAAEGSQAPSAPCDQACIDVLVSADMVGDDESERLQQLMRAAVDTNEDSDSLLLAQLSCVVRAIHAAAQTSRDTTSVPHLLFASLSSFQHSGGDPSARLSFVLAVVSAHIGATRTVNKSSMVAAVVLPGTPSASALPHSHPLIHQAAQAASQQRPGARQLRTVSAAKAAAAAQAVDAKTPADVAAGAVMITTVIVLIVAFIMATAYLFNMPLTRDTLLYSGGPKMD